MDGPQSEIYMLVTFNYNARIFMFSNHSFDIKCLDKFDGQIGRVRS